MRDILFIVIFFAMLLMSAGRPSLGLLVWIWTALVTPNYLVYGFAQSIRFNLIAALVTMLSWLASSEPKSIIFDGQAKTVMVFYLWTLVSTVFALHDSLWIMHTLDTFSRGLLLFVVTLLVVRTREHVTLVAWAIVLALGVYSGIEGLKYIMSGGGHKIVGATRTILGDNNHLAVAINMMIPFAGFLLVETESRVSKYLLAGFIVISCVAVIGTNSRGGFGGLAGLAIAWSLFGNKKIYAIFFIVLGIIAFYAFVPETYVGRIETIGNATSDSSFSQRVMAWKMCLLIALDNPLTGGGFMAVQTYEIWQHYAQNFELLSFIESENASEYDYKAAHSIYFQVLSDQGFIGFFLFLSIFISSGRRALSLSRRHIDDIEIRWCRRFAFASYLSLFAYAVSGGLLSMAYFELPYLIVACLCIVNKFVNDYNPNIKTGTIHLCANQK